jgi:hypothetical protein
MSSSTKVTQPSNKKVDLCNLSLWLTAKQRLFCHAVAADPELNYHRAAKKVGFAASSIGNLTKNEHIKSFIGRILYERAKQFEVTGQRVVEELTRIGLFNPQRLFDQSGNLLPILELSEETASALSSMDVETEVRVTTTLDGKKTIERTTTITKYRFWNKLDALRNLCEHLGLLKPSEPNSNVNVLVLDWNNIMARARNEETIDGNVNALPVPPSSVSGADEIEQCIKQISKPNGAK